MKQFPFIETGMTEQAQTPKHSVMDAIEGTSLDELWIQARNYGRVSLEENHSRDKHEVKVVFSTKAGSYISAKGEGTTPHQALRAAIKEAAALQCGVEFANG